MKPLAVGLLLMTVALPWPCIVTADPRGVAPPPGPVTPEMLLARQDQAARHMAAWLPRLVGAYSYEGVAYVPGTSFPPVRVAGSGECRSVGIGPGTVCMVELNGMQELIAYGIDPQASRITYLRVDSDGFPEDRLGVVRGNTMFSRAHCVNTPAARPRCERIYKIYATPDPRSLRVTIEVQIDDRPPTVTDLVLTPVAT